MQSVKELKQRIKSIGDTAQITRAMKLISVAKMRRANILYDTDKKYFSFIKDTMVRILAHTDLSEHKYIVHKTIKKAAYIVIASDMGMAGGFNHNILSFAERNVPHDATLITIGKKAKEFFDLKGMSPDIEYVNILDNPELEDARNITIDVLNLYNNDMLSEVKIIYSQMKTSSTHTPVIMDLLPLDLSTIKNEGNDISQDYAYDIIGDKDKTMSIIIEQYVQGVIYSAIINSIACEHYERMVAMDSASRNCDKMLELLNKEYNRLRQDKITTELCETVGSANYENK